MKYSYFVKDKQGAERRGKVEASSEQAAIKLLKNQGFVVINLSSKKEGLDLSKLFQKLQGRVYGEKIAFTRQMATMISAGLPVAQALEILSKQTSSERMRQVLGESLADVKGGSSLSKSFGKHKDVFDNTYISLVEAGETSGTLDKLLLRLADNLEKNREFRSKTRGALIYPAIVTVAMIVVFIIMVVFVIPKLSDMYETLGAELPLPTQILIGMSNAITQGWWAVILLIGIFAAGIRFYAKTDVGKRSLAEISFRLPIFGKLNKKKDLTEFTRTFGLLIGSGIPIIDALGIVSGSFKNILYVQAITEVSQKVEKGSSLSKAIQEDELFPPIVSQMVGVGEETGKVDEVLSKLSIFFEGEVDNVIKNLSVALEPLIMIVLGLMVGLLILSIITPIYKLTSQF